MNIFLIVFGFFLWILFTTITYLYFSPSETNLRGRLLYALLFKGLSKADAELGVSTLQLTGAVWFITGLIATLINRKIFEGIGGMKELEELFYLSLFSYFLLLLVPFFQIYEGDNSSYFCTGEARRGKRQPARFLFWRYSYCKNTAAGNAREWYGVLPAHLPPGQRQPDGKRQRGKGGRAALQGVGGEPLYFWKHLHQLSLHGAAGGWLHRVDPDGRTLV